MFHYLYESNHISLLLKNKTHYVEFIDFIAYQMKKITHIYILYCNLIMSRRMSMLIFSYRNHCSNQLHWHCHHPQTEYALQRIYGIIYCSTLSSTTSSEMNRIFRATEMCAHPGSRAVLLKSTLRRCRF